MKLTIFTDVHKYSAMALDVEFEFGPNVVFLGDNIDRRGCKKSEVEKVASDWLDLAISAKRSGSVWVTGNHDLTEENLSDVREIEGKRVFFTHGDFGIFWSKNRSIKFRRQTPGASFLKRALWVNFLEALEMGWGRPIQQDEIDRALEVAYTNGCDIICLGHKHPKETYDVTHQYGGKLIRVVVFKRGRSEIEVA